MNLLATMNKIRLLIAEVARRWLRLVYRTVVVERWQKGSCDDFYCDSALLGHSGENSVNMGSPKV